MKLSLLLLFAVQFVGCNKSRSGPKMDYVITEHHIIPASDSDVQRDEYTVRHGDAILTVLYSESQSNSAPFDPSNLEKQTLPKPKDLHSFYYRGDVDLSQVPEVGTPIRQCITHKNEFHGDELVIAVQPTPDPCMTRNGSMLQYEPEPNAGRYTHVDFEIVSERMDKQ